MDLFVLENTLIKYIIINFYDELSTKIFLLDNNPPINKLY